MKIPLKDYVNKSEFFMNQTETTLIMTSLIEDIVNFSFRMY